MPVSILTFDFVAHTDSREIHLRVTMEDDGSPMVDIADNAYDIACQRAEKKLGSDFDCVSA